MTRNEFTWERHAGRNPEGERFDSNVMVHGTGRILARVGMPIGEEYWYRLYFYVPKCVLDSPDDCHDFISADAAVEFAENVAMAWSDETLAKIPGFPKRVSAPVEQFS
jgi:hypothetical protein